MAVPSKPAAPSAPTPRRLSRPRWLNVRVVGGIVLVIAAVVIGARVIGGSARTIGVWAADRDLAAGTVLSEGDLSTTEVDLGNNADLYLTPDVASPIGLTVVTPLRAGELLAASAVEEPASGRVVAVGVEPNNMPPGVGHGSIIDLYLTTRGCGRHRRRPDHRADRHGHHRAIRHRTGERRTVRRHFQPVPGVGHAARGRGGQTGPHTAER